MTSSLSLSIAAVAKELLLIVVSVAALHDAVTPTNAGGFALTASGVVAYNVHKCAQRRSPTTAPGSLLHAARQPYQRVPADAENADDAGDDVPLVPLAAPRAANDGGRDRAASCPTVPEDVDF